MRIAFLPRLLVVVFVLTGFLLVACSDDGDGDAETPLNTPNAGATATPETEPPTATSEASAPATATPALPTATAVPGETPEGRCPIEEIVCNMAESLEVALQDGNYGAIVELRQSREETCPGGEPQGAGGPFPLCEGAPQGEVRTGYQLSRRYSEGFIVSFEGAVMFLEGFVNAASPDVSDDHGSGEVRLQAVSCVLPTGSDCSEGSIIFTAILVGNRRELLTFFVPIPANATAPIGRAQTGVVMEDEEPALFESGGEVVGLGQVYVLE